MDKRTIISHLSGKDRLANSVGWKLRVRSSLTVAEITWNKYNELLQTLELFLTRTRLSVKYQCSSWSVDILIWGDFDSWKYLTSVIEVRPRGWNPISYVNCMERKQSALFSQFCHLLNLDVYYSLPCCSCDGTGCLWGELCPVHLCWQIRPRHGPSLTLTSQSCLSKLVRQSQLHTDLTGQQRECFPHKGMS